MRKKLYVLSVILLLFIGMSVQLTNFKSSLYKSVDYVSTSPIHSTRNMELGAWIIIGGYALNQDDVRMYKRECDTAYRSLRQIGYPTDRIYYCGPEITADTPYTNATATLANVQYAIENWATTKVNSLHGLGIFLDNHGGNAYIGLVGGYTSEYHLNATTLNNFLSTLETVTGLDEEVIIIDACHSGSFIPTLSRPYRIIITSTDSPHNAFAMGNGAIFCMGFWGAITFGATLGQAFEAARQNVINMRCGDVQFPLLDDNGDGIGHQTSSTGRLPNDGDGFIALNTSIQYIVNNFPLQTGILNTMFPIYISPLRTTITPWVLINPNNAITNVTICIIPGNWTPPESQTLETLTLKPVINDIEERLLSDQEEDGNYTDTYWLPSGFQPDDSFYLIFNINSEMGLIDSTMSKIEVTSDGNPPIDVTPPTVDFLWPWINAELMGVINITVQGDDDQNLTSIDILIDGNVKSQYSMGLVYPYPAVDLTWDTTIYSNGVHNLTAIARDHEGWETQISNLVYINNPESTTEKTDSSISSNTNDDSRKNIAGYSFPIIVGFLIIIPILSSVRKIKKNER